MLQTKNLSLFALLALFCVLAGCANKIKIEGKVTFSDDGSPLPVGTICFQGDSFLARGELNQDGIFTVGMLSEKDGLPPGKYRVFITGADQALDEQDGIARSIPLIDGKYGDPASSGLEFEITPSTKQIDFTVDRAKSTRSR